MRNTELERFKAQLGDLTPEQRAAVDQMTRRIVNKILHSPISKSKEIASSTQGHVYLEALYELFELDDDTQQ
mgnify:CR=1 FL=1